MGRAVKGGCDALHFCFAGVFVPESRQKGLARITSRGQTTIPKKIREVANLREGDLIAFEVVADHVVVRKVVPAEDGYLKGISEVLSEWVSREDEETWRDL